MTFALSVRPALLASAAFLSLGFAGAAQAQEAAPRRGGEFVYLQSSFPPCLDVAQSARAQNATRQALDNLLDQDKETGEILPWLASAWRFENEGRRLVLTLREGVTFSNGEVFDAAAVKANFDSLVQLGREGRASQASGYLSGYVDAEILDDRTVALNFDVPKAGLVQALTEKTLSPLAPETLAKTPEARCAGELIGSGPFVISEVLRNDRIALERREDYAWASPNAEHEGPAWLDRVVFRTVPEGSVRVGALISGQAHAIDEIPTDDIDQAKAAGAQILSRTAGGVGITIYPNLDRPALADEAVRRALQRGIDRQEIVEALYSEYDTASTSILSSTVPGHVDLGDRLGYDPQEAARILDEAGWVPGPDGVRTKDGRRLSLEAIWSFPGYTAVLELIREQLAPVGVELTLNLRPDSEIGGLVREGRFDLRLADLTRPDPDVLQGVFSTRFGRALGAPVPEVEDLIDRQSAAIDPAERRRLVRELQEVLVDKGYGLPIKESITIVALRPNAQGLWLSTPRWPVFHDAWLRAD